MTIQDDFEKAQENVKGLKVAPDTHKLLELYAFYKQATSGDATGERPGMMDFRGRAKFDAWTGVKGTSKEAAMEAYIAVVEKLRSA